MLKTIIFMIGLILLCAIASAEVPNVINYQGYLTDSNGDPVDGPMLINFKIYGTETGDDSLWSSGFQEVTIANGLINYQLGLSSPLPDDLFASPVRYLGIKVGTDPEIAPRTAITSTAFAWQALRSDSADYADYAVEAGYAWTSSLANDAQNAENLDGFDGSYYLDWYNLNSIPADFADGIDDVGGGGDITGVIAEGGLAGGGESGEVVLTIADNGVASGHIQDGAILDMDISSDANIDPSKINGTAVNLTDVQAIEGAKTFEDLSIGTTTRRLALSSAAFVPLNNSISFIRLGTYVHGTTTLGSLALLANASLPDGATVIEVKATFYDNEGVNNNGQIKLFKAYMPSGGEIEMASALTAGTPGLTTISDVSIVSETISNDGYNYWLVIEMSWNDSADNLKFYGAEIVYTITRPLP